MSIYFNEFGNCKYLDIILYSKVHGQYIYIFFFSEIKIKSLNKFYNAVNKNYLKSGSEQIFYTLNSQLRCSVPDSTRLALWKVNSIVFVWTSKLKQNMSVETKIRMRRLFQRLLNNTTCGFTNRYLNLFCASVFRQVLYCKT